MGLHLPSELTEPLGWIGLTWPEADEELLFDAGQAWIRFAQHLQAEAHGAEAAAVSAWSRNAGDSTDAFRQWWTGADGPDSRLREDVEAALLIGAALLVFAAITLALKLAFIAQLAALVVEVAQAVGTAFVSFGATLAEVPGFIAATRLVCKRLIAEAVERLQRVLADLFGRARELLRLAPSTPGAAAAARAGAHGIPPRITSGPLLRTKPMLDDFADETQPFSRRFPFSTTGLGYSRRPGTTRSSTGKRCP